MSGLCCTRDAYVPLFHSYPNIFVYPLSFKYSIKCSFGTFLYLLLFTDLCFKLCLIISGQWIAVGIILISSKGVSRVSVKQV